MLIATPEYNYSIPGVLKNAIDWVSRPPKDCGLRKKPLGIVGASSGESGTMRGQLAIRQVFVFLDAYVMAQPEFRLPKAGEKCDESGELSRRGAARAAAGLRGRLGRLGPAGQPHGGRVSRPRAGPEFNRPRAASWSSRGSVGHPR